MANYLKIQGWTVNFLQIYKLEENKLTLENGREIFLTKKEREILQVISDKLGLPNLFFI